MKKKHSISIFKLAVLFSIVGVMLVGTASESEEATSAKSSTAMAIGPLYAGGTNIYFTPKEHPEWIQQVTSYRVYSSVDQYFYLNFTTHQLIIQPSNAPVRTINLTEAEANAMRDAILAAANQRK